MRHTASAAIPPPFARTEAVVRWCDGTRRNAPEVRPRKGELDRTCWPADRTIEPCMTGNVQHPGEIGEVVARMHTLATGNESWRFKKRA
jgi:hypothetical protein